MPYIYAASLLGQGTSLARFLVFNNSLRQLLRTTSIWPRLLPFKSLNLAKTSSFQILFNSLCTTYPYLPYCVVRDSIGVVKHTSIQGTVLRSQQMQVSVPRHELRPSTRQCMNEGRSLLLALLDRHTE